jgi:hypothetical protein
MAQKLSASARPFVPPQGTTVQQAVVRPSFQQAQPSMSRDIGFQQSRSGAGARPATGGNTRQAQHQPQQQAPQKRYFGGEKKEWRNTQNSDTTQKTAPKRHSEPLLSSALIGYTQHRNMERLVTDVLNLKRFQVLYRVIAEKSLWESLIVPSMWTQIKTKHYDTKNLETSAILTDARKENMSNKLSFTCFTVWYKNDVLLNRSDDDIYNMIRIGFELIDDGNLTRINKYDEDILQCFVKAHADKELPRFTNTSLYFDVYNLFTMSSVSLSGTASAILNKAPGVIPDFSAYLSWIMTAPSGGNILASVVVDLIIAKGRSVETVSAPIIEALSRSVDIKDPRFALFYSSHPYPGKDSTLVEFKKCLATEMVRRGIAVAEDAEAKKMAASVANRIAPENAMKFADTIANVMNRPMGARILAKPFFKNLLEVGGTFKVTRDLIHKRINSYKNVIVPTLRDSFILALKEEAESCDFKALFESGGKRDTTCGIIIGITGGPSTTWMTQIATISPDAVMYAILSAPSVSQKYVSFASTITSGPLRYDAKDYVEKHASTFPVSAASATSATPENWDDE